MKTLNSGVLYQTATQFLKAFGVVLAISFFDAIIGAAISSALWPKSLSTSQAGNDAYQLGLAGWAFFVLAVVGSKNLLVGATAGIMLVAYLEDTLYYLLLWLTKPVILWLFNGILVVNTGFPVEIGGWIGWLSRFFGAVPSFSLPLHSVVLLNIGGTITAWWLLYVENSKE